MTQGHELKVVQTFDSSKNYGVHLPNKFKRIYSDLKEGQIIQSTQFIREEIPKYSKSTNNTSMSNMGWRILKTGVSIGILKKQNEFIPPISINDFRELETVSYWLGQLRNSRYKNIKISKNGLSGTQDQYSYRLWVFNSWLHGKTFEIHQTRQISDDEFKVIVKKITLEGVEHLLKLYQKPHIIESDFIKILKRYLIDPMHSKKKATTINIMYNAIKSYFDKNESPIIFKFDPKARYENTSEREPYALSLSDLMKLLTVGQPSLTEKAVFLVKFQRGLDASTLADRFNFEAWKQICDYFGTEQYQRWDLDKCPVPIRLVRIKTGFNHIGFLDRDAIISLQDYLDYRFSKTGKIMDEKEGLFLNKFNKPISTQWIQNKFFKLAKRCKLTVIVNSYGNQYSFSSHEVRDLLKSTLIDCGTRIDVADHVIGHMPKDSYEKQAKLYPESMREQYMKASPKINLFSNMTSNLQTSVNTRALQTEVDTLKEIVIRLQQKDEIRNSIVDVANF